MNEWTDLGQDHQPYVRCWNGPLESCWEIGHVEAAQVPPQRLPGEYREKTLLAQRKNRWSPPLIEWSHFQGTAEQLILNAPWFSSWRALGEQAFSHGSSWEVQWFTVHVCMCLYIHPQSKHMSKHPCQYNYTNYWPVRHWPHHLVFQISA